MNYITDVNHDKLKSSVTISNNMDGKIEIMAKATKEGDSSSAEVAACCLTDLMAIMTTAIMLMDRRVDDSGSINQLVQIISDEYDTHLVDRLVHDEVATLFGDEAVMLQTPRFQCDNEELASFIYKSLSIKAMRFNFYGDIDNASIGSQLMSVFDSIISTSVAMFLKQWPPVYNYTEG